MTQGAVARTLERKSEAEGSDDMFGTTHVSSDRAVRRGLPTRAISLGNRVCQRPALGGGPGAFSSSPAYQLYEKDCFMTDTERRILHRFLKAEWEKTRTDYRAAGAPFGSGRGLEIWIQFGQLTTVN